MHWKPRNKKIKKRVQFWWTPCIRVRLTCRWAEMYRNYKTFCFDRWPVLVQASTLVERSVENWNWHYVFLFLSNFSGFPEQIYFHLTGFWALQKEYWSEILTIVFNYLFGVTHNGKLTFYFIFLYYFLNFPRNHIHFLTRKGEQFHLIIYSWCLTKMIDLK